MNDATNNVQENLDPPVGGCLKVFLIILLLMIFAFFIWPGNELGMMPIWGESIDAQVVDAETHRPLEGVTVVVDWPSVNGSLAGGTRHYGGVHHYETLTGKDGYFHIPRWITMGYQKWVSVQDPTIDLYKPPGYWSRRLKNQGESMYGMFYWPRRWKSDWDGKVIELKPTHWRKWTREEWLQNEKKGWDGLAARWGDCRWKKYPEYVIGIIRLELRKQEIFNRTKEGLFNWIKFFEKVKDKCDADPFEYLHEHGLTSDEWEYCCVRKKQQLKTGSLSPYQVIDGHPQVLKRLQRK